MSKIVAYYSKDGNCKALAKALSEKFGCELFELQEESPRKNNILGFMRCGMDAFFNKRSKLTIDVKEKFFPYDEIVLVSPVWASNIVPAINTVLYGVDLSGKKVTLFACQADTELSALKKIKTKFKSILQKSGGIYAKCYCVQGAPPGKNPFSQERFENFLTVLLKN
jgi:flavodoxin